MINRKYSAWTTGLCAAVATSALLAGTPADADTFVPLPGGEISRTLPDGTVVTVRLDAESATISPSMGATPIHRNAWVSGRAEAQVSKPAVKASIQPGYVVGCQVNIDGGGASGGATVQSDWEGEKVSGGLTSGANLSLGPGQATSFVILDRESANKFGEESHSSANPFKGASGSVSWSDSTIGLDGCAGYAQARAFVKVKVQTDTVSNTVTLWGQPFSLG